MTLPATAPTNGNGHGNGGSVMEAVLMKGDLAQLTPAERVRYYGEVCKSLGLNPLTKPFEYITLNNKLQLYALRSCTDQLRKVHAVSLEIVSRDVADGILTVHVRARLPDGRVDEDLGAVAFSEQLKGEARANAELKAITKAKRRATLSICGLGWLDETEVADIPAQAKRSPPAPAGNPMIAVDATTDAATDAATESERIMALDRALGEAAAVGTEALQSVWASLSNSDKAILKAALDRRHKPTATLADAELQP